MIRLAHALAVLLVSAAHVHGQALAGRLSLDDAVALALRENPTLRAKQWSARYQLEAAVGGGVETP